jgi:hypothetical protein
MRRAMVSYISTVDPQSSIGEGTDAIVHPNPNDTRRARGLASFDEPCGITGDLLGSRRVAPSIDPHHNCCALLLIKDCLRNNHIEKQAVFSGARIRWDRSSYGRNFCKYGLLRDEGLRGVERLTFYERCGEIHRNGEPGWVCLGTDGVDFPLVDNCASSCGGQRSCKSQVSNRWLRITDVGEVVVPDCRLGPW